MPKKPIWSMMAATSLGPPIVARIKRTLAAFRLRIARQVSLGEMVERLQDPRTGNEVRKYIQKCGHPDRPDDRAALRRGYWHRSRSSPKSRPASAPGISHHWTATRTKSRAAASLTVPARIEPPDVEASPAILSGPRLCAMAGLMHALPNAFASAPPILAAPTIPTVMSQSSNHLFPLTRECTLHRHIKSRRWIV